MANRTVLISVLCKDRTGLVAALTGRLFDLGAMFSDTSFAVLGEGAEFTAVCDLPESWSLAEVEIELRELDAVDKTAQITITPFELGSVHGPSGHITHRIVVSGGDRPGILARLSETFIEFDANIVRLNAERIPDEQGGRYVIRLATSIPPEKADSCLATINNTAGELGLSCHWFAASDKDDGE